MGLLARACLLASLFVACGMEPAESAEAPQVSEAPEAPATSESAASPRPRNLIVIALDTLRADHLGCYGYARDTSPGIDAFAARGVLFEHAFTTASWTLPAHASLFTGLYARSHGVDGLGKRLSPEARTMAELFHDAGFETTAIVNVYFLGKYSTLARGFDNVAQYEPKADARGCAPRLLEAARTWISHRERPFFLFLHCYDAHASYQAEEPFAAPFRGPYEGPVDGTGGQLFQYNEGRIERNWGPADAQRLADLYDGGIRQLDDRLAGFLRFLDDAGRLADTLVVLTSDHGEAFLEHGFVMHGRTVYEEELGVPLLLVGPGVAAGVRVGDRVSLVDVLPTVLGAFDLPAPEYLEGLDLTPTWREGPPLAERNLFFETEGGLADQAPQRAMRSGSFKLYRDERADTARLFDLERDPGERTDVAADRPQVFTRLSAELRAFEEQRRAIAPAGEPSAEELETLRMLGYL